MILDLLALMFWQYLGQVKTFCLKALNKIAGLENGQTVLTSVLTISDMVKIPNKNIGNCFFTNTYIKKKNTYLLPTNDEY